MNATAEKLATDNHNLVYSFLQKYHLNVDDHYDLAAIGLCKAANTYTTGKSSFSTYAYRCMFTTVMQELRKIKFEKTIPENKIVSLQTEIKNGNGDMVMYSDFIPSGENVENEAVSNCMFEEYVRQLKERDKLIFHLFSEGYKQQEIGRIAGCSQAQVSRVRRKLKEYLIGQS